MARVGRNSFNYISIVALRISPNNSAVNILARTQLLCRRKYRARRLGFRFRRAAEFEAPSCIRVGNSLVPLSLPDDTGTRTAFVDILLDDCYSLAAIPDDVKTVIDIGSHAGLFAVAARRRWPNAVIHCYEPNQCLRVHWSRQADQVGFDVYEEAVGESAAKVGLVTNDDSVQVRAIEIPGGPIHQSAFSEAVKRIGGDVDVVKLDCEGGEWSILKDAQAWQNIRFLTMEFHLWAGYTAKELEFRISELGFQITRLQKTGPDFGLLSARRI